ncbi:hypothetical protein CDD80_676 [Ophiocordyceps camponoti-rufipedis]|uniref:Uncharacterized protein n=1 Tax=Ophiocordyceps camponoti-rufipedis TaxID=2004952 RepID=A0A2C5XNW4_9HYPO|nr:hypothetical protein CDD80_676 [Ophiocordyceps camponoti-rufipedis]
MSYRVLKVRRRSFGPRAYIEAAFHEALNQVQLASQQEPDNISRSSSRIAVPPLIITHGPPDPERGIRCIYPPHNLRRRPLGPNSSIDAILDDAQQSLAVVETRPHLFDTEPDTLFSNLPVNNRRPSSRNRRSTSSRRSSSPGLLHSKWKPKRSIAVNRQSSRVQKSRHVLYPGEGRRAKAQLPSAGEGARCDMYSRDAMEVVIDNRMANDDVHVKMEADDADVEMNNDSLDVNMDNDDMDEDDMDDDMDDVLYMSDMEPLIAVDDLGKEDEMDESDDDSLDTPPKWKRSWIMQYLDEPGEWLCWICDRQLNDPKDPLVRVPGHPIRQRHCAYCDLPSFCKLYY